MVSPEHYGSVDVVQKHPPVSIISSISERGGSEERAKNYTPSYVALSQLLILLLRSFYSEVKLCTPLCSFQSSICHFG